MDASPSPSLRAPAKILWRVLAMTVLVWSFLFSFASAIAEEIKYDKGDRRDPFTPLVGPHAGKKMEIVNQRLPIEGIIFDPDAGGSYVLIGGQVFQEGDAIEEAQIVRILPNRIILLQQSKEVVIWLREEILEEQQQKAPKKPPKKPSGKP